MSWNGCQPLHEAMEAYSQEGINIATSALQLISCGIHEATFFTAICDRPALHPINPEWKNLSEAKFRAFAVTACPFQIYW